MRLIDATIQAERAEARRRGIVDLSGAMVAEAAIHGIFDKIRRETNLTQVAEAAARLMWFLAEHAGPNDEWLLQIIADPMVGAKLGRVMTDLEQNLRRLYPNEYHPKRRPEEAGAGDPIAPV
jgi:hypothetical protein